MLSCNFSCSDPYALQYHVALCRCLRAGAKYDLKVVFRLCQLWFQLSTTDIVNHEMALTIKDVPSRKFLPLAYQIASRLGGSASGQLSNSKFQVRVRVTPTPCFCSSSQDCRQSDAVVLSTGKRKLCCLTGY